MKKGKNHHWYKEDRGTTYFLRDSQGSSGDRETDKHGQDEERKESPLVQGGQGQEGQEGLRLKRKAHRTPKEGTWGAEGKVRPHWEAQGKAKGSVEVKPASITRDLGRFW